MKSPEDLAAELAEDTTAQLLAMFERPDAWPPQVLDAARVELQKRGVDLASIRVGPRPLAVGQPAFFPVSITKLVVMSMVTFGLYELYWFYRNWKFIKERTGRHIRPFWRSVFSIIFVYPCFRQVRDAAETRDIRFRISPEFLAFSWIAIAIGWRLPHTSWLLYFLNPLPLVPVQRVINRVNMSVAPEHNINARFSLWNICAVVFGGIIFVLVLIG